MSRVPRLFCDLRLTVGGEFVLPDDTAHHVQRVLRLRRGDPVVLFSGDGHDCNASLTLVSRGEVRVQVHSVGPPESEPILRLHLVLGISRGQRMDFALQKATELGVTAITPLFTDRSVVHLRDERLDQRWSHWRQVTISACEQSSRRHLPDIHHSLDFRTWIAGWRGDGVLLDPLASSGLAELSPPTGELVLLVGPEGGLSEEERRLARDKGLQGVRLGPYILRTETAPLAAIAAMQMLWGSFR